MIREREGNLQSTEVLFQVAGKSPEIARNRKENPHEVTARDDTVAAPMGVGQRWFWSWDYGCAFGSV
ncbi:hypothetical protein CTI12_AA331500 [Artemisia annua]|uniref:Uncharacterized protein n=1 Tax=Artemisia annua TaxID=35608 RepID=A0A2U1MX99_ARTAN|nr:hypothetical protein CTI12_AA331500 [Artemisia annua]